MKTKRDPRHLKRIAIVQELFAHNFQAKFNLKPKPHHQSTIEILEHQSEINQIISKHAPAWPINQISPVDLAVLTLAVWELLYEKKNPIKVIIDEAVEIAKSYGSETSGSFVNGVLGSIVNENKIEKQNGKA